MTTTPPESAILMTTHEVLALLSLNRGPAEQATRAMLKLADHADGSELVRAGFSTLAVRNLLEQEGDEVTPIGPAKALAQILTSATVRVDATVADSSSTSITFLLESPAGKVALFARPASILMCVPLEPAVDCTEMALDLAAANFAAHGRDSLVSLRRRSGTRPTAVANVRRTDAHGWELARRSADGGSELDVVPCTGSAEAFSRLREALGVPA